jgi:hypothetical protein
MSSLSVFRYITENITHVSLSVMSRILFFHEMICSCVYLIEKAPWLRKKPTNQKQLQRFDSGIWKDISVEDLPLLSKIEAQVWLTLYHLLLEPECRKKYDFNDHNKSIVLRVCLLLKKK